MINNYYGLKEHQSTHGTGIRVGFPSHNRSDVD